MTERQIQYFLAAAKHLSFTSAAKELFITQPALSRQIIALEAELNLQLFVRHKNQLRLTPAAVVLMQELPEYERHFERIMEKVRTMNAGCSGELRISIIAGVPIPEPFKKAYLAFREQHPEIKIQLSADTFSSQRQALDQQEVDLILTSHTVIRDDPRYIYEDICENRIVFGMSDCHPAAKREIRSLADLRDETFIITDHVESEHMIQDLLDLCAREGFTPNLISARTPGEQMVMLDAGIGVSIFTRDLYITHIPNFKVLDQLAGPKERYVLAWRKDNVDVAIAQFTNYIAEQIKAK